MNGKCIGFPNFIGKYVVELEFKLRFINIKTTYYILLNENLHNIETFSVPS